MHHPAREQHQGAAMNVAERSLAALLVAMALSACSGGQEESREPLPVEETVFGDTVGAMDKARAVEDLTLQHKEDLDKALDAAEGGQ
jgi:hypothetical protein